MCMSLTEELFRTYVRGVLLEKAIDVGHAEQNAVACFTNEKTVILYDPKVLLKFYQDMVNAHLRRMTSKPKTSNRLSGEKSASPAILSIVKFNPVQRGEAYGAKEIEISAARKGWGPLTYDIAMSISRTGLMPDHNNSVSPTASNVWKNYYDNRPDVRKLRLDDMNNPKTVPKLDDAQTHNDPDRAYLDYIYQIKSPIDINKLTSVHKRCVADILELVKTNKLLYDTRQITYEIMIGAEDFFDGKYFKQ